MGLDPYLKTIRRLFYLLIVVSHKLQDCTYCIKTEVVCTCSCSVVLMLYHFYSLMLVAIRWCVHILTKCLKTLSLLLTDKSDIKRQAR